MPRAVPSTQADYSPTLDQACNASDTQSSSAEPARPPLRHSLVPWKPDLTAFASLCRHKRPSPAAGKAGSRSARGLFSNDGGRGDAWQKSYAHDPSWQVGVLFRPGRAAMKSDQAPELSAITPLPKPSTREWGATYGSASSRRSKRTKPTKNMAETSGVSGCSCASTSNSSVTKYSSAISPNA